jgi:hypothetical protein
VQTSRQLARGLRGVITGLAPEVGGQEILTERRKRIGQLGF